MSSTFINTFTFERNTIKRSVKESTESAKYYIELVKSGGSLDKTDSNRVGALASSIGFFRKDGQGTYKATELAEVFLRLYEKNKDDAWRWVITRALWRYLIPNGTNSKVNGAARNFNPSISFSFFRTFLGLLTHLDAEEGIKRYVTYEEICNLLKEDANWILSSKELFNLLSNYRSANPNSINATRKFLDDLEEPQGEFGIPKDNFSTVFNKVFAQTGMFDYLYRNSSEVAIALSASLDKIMRGRIRFILDHPVLWDETNQSWADFLELQTTDLPEEVSYAEVAEASVPLIPVAQAPIGDIVKASCETFQEANFSITEELMARFVASLLTKPFVILTGLTGSGKTKLAQAFAAWLSTSLLSEEDRFKPGSEVKAARITYYVKSSDILSVEIWNSQDKNTVNKVLLPRELIREWADCIIENNFTRDTPVKSIRDKVAEKTNYSAQINSFDSMLMALAFALIETPQIVVSPQTYEVVPVGADWTGNEHILGYADALNPERYIRTQTLSLLLRAELYPKLPHFLILDEMNLSHVERYFADLLSAIESGEGLKLHDSKDEIGSPLERDGVPGSLKLPQNVFIVGTVNIDETTYMFSPKVLDRANVIEFRVSPEDLENFLKEPSGIDLKKISGDGAGFAQSLVSASRSEPSLLIEELEILKLEFSLFFRVLANYGAEFGFRTTKEIARFIGFHKALSDSTAWQLANAFDAQVVQKMLPKLNGSRRKLEPILVALANLCYKNRDFSKGIDKQSYEILFEKAIKAGKLEEDGLHPLTNPDEFKPENAYYKLSYAKIKRMLDNLERNGFTSFAEA